jgi:hypothetical protein
MASKCSKGHAIALKSKSPFPPENQARSVQRPVGSNISEVELAPAAAVSRMSNSKIRSLLRSSHKAYGFRIWNSLVQHVCAHLIMGDICAH